jgi:hypothetical protein
VAFLLVGNYGIAALAVSALASSLAAPFVYLLAERRPGAFGAAALLAVGPPLWMLASTHSYSEGLFVPLFMASVLAGRRNRLALSVSLGVLAALTRHAGVFLAPILLAQQWQRGQRRPAVLSVCVLPAIALPLLEVYLRMGIPGCPGLLATHVAFFGGTGDMTASHFALPLTAIIEGFRTATEHPLQALLNACSLVAVSLALAWSLARGQLDTLVWSGLFLALT